MSYILQLQVSCHRRERLPQDARCHLLEKGFIGGNSA